MIRQQVYVKMQDKSVTIEHARNNPGKAKWHVSATLSTPLSSSNLEESGACISFVVFASAFEFVVKSRYVELVREQVQGHVLEHTLVLISPRLKSVSLWKKLAETFMTFLADPAEHTLGLLGKEVIDVAIAEDIELR